MTAPGIPDPVHRILDVQAVEDLDRRIVASTGTDPFLSLLMAAALLLVGGIVTGSVLVVRRGR